MASDEDNFDIDVYGDGDEEKDDIAVDDAIDIAVDDPRDVTEDSTHDVLVESADDAARNVNQDGDLETTNMNGEYEHAAENVSGSPHGSSDTVTESFDANEMSTRQDVEMETGNQRISTADGPSQDHVEAPKQPPQKQGTKRKEGPDDRPTDHGATTAIVISELNWWSTDDDIRGWTNQAGCEDELKDITFHEHKVNGKCKGQAFIEFTSPQAATAVKRKVESFGAAQQQAKKYTVTYASPANNPYRTFPKDAPVRGKDGPRPQDLRSAGNSYNGPIGMGNGPTPGNMHFGMNNFRGGRGGYANRGNPMNTMVGFPNRNFSGPMGGVPPGGFPGGPMGGFAGPAMGGMSPYGGFPNRGGMMGGMRGGPVGNRGGRGGMNPTGMMGGMPGMGGMGGMMGGMPGPMGGLGGMGGMGGNMNMNPMAMQGQPLAQGGFQGPQPHFNPAFFNQNQGNGGDGNWNPHGAKRQRPE